MSQVESDKTKRQDPEPSKGTAVNPPNDTSGSSESRFVFSVAGMGLGLPALELNLMPTWILEPFE